MRDEGEAAPPAEGEAAATDERAAIPTDEREEAESSGGAWKTVGAMLLATIALLLLLEGASSVFLAVWGATRPPGDPTYGRYDSLVGWVSAPSLDLPDLWGPGRGLRTNERGWRVAGEVWREVPPGRSRALCSGDSFAFGEGVGNEDTWCHVLGVLEPRLETVNLGQPGYGVDQAYLRYRRDGALVEHSIHVFTFIDADFKRMGPSMRFGYGKPRFRLEGDSLVLENVPPARLLPTLARFVSQLSEDLRTVELGLRAIARLRPEAAPADGDAVDPELASIATRVLRRVGELGRQRGAVTLFVYLPTLLDIENDMPWRLRAREILADRLGAPYVDLTEALRELPPQERRALFIPEGAPAADHYSPAGNAWVAGRLYERLRELGALPADPPTPRSPSGTS